MASGVEELLSMLYDMIDEGKPVPMHAELCKIDRDRALDLLDEIRAQFPVELGEAQKLVAAKDEYIANARREADAMKTDAQEQVKRLLNDNELVIQARETANGILKKAQDQANGLRQAANAYCVDVLTETEASVAQASEELRQAKAKFSAMAGSASSVSAAPDRPAIYDAEED